MNERTLVKNTPTPMSTAITIGMSSRLRRRFVMTTSDDTSDRSHAHSSSDPAWLPHMAVTLYPHPSERDEYPATFARSKRSVTSPVHMVRAATVVTPVMPNTARSADIRKRCWPGRRDQRAAPTAYSAAANARRSAARPMRLTCPWSPWDP